MRREVAREEARIRRERAEQRKRRNRMLLQGGLTLGIVAVVAIVVLVVVNLARPGAPSSSQAGPANMISDGILLSGSGMAAVPTKALQAGETPIPTATSDYPDTINIVSYVDYQCPFCQQFEATNSAQIKQWVESGQATVEIHPIAILDRASLGARYSTRAANAMACVANYQPAAFYAAQDALFGSQPKESTSGLTNNQLVSLVQTSGATDADISTCITGEEFSDWVGEATERALRQPLPNTTIGPLLSTPTVLVNGQKYEGSLQDPGAFRQFVANSAQK